jgi:hypothetical protein
VTNRAWPAGPETPRDRPHRRTTRESPQFQVVLERIQVARPGQKNQTPDTRTAADEYVPATGAGVTQQDTPADRYIHNEAHDNDRTRRCGMLRLDAVYGIDALEQWKLRRDTDDRQAMRDLSDTKRSSGQDTAGVMDIATFDDLLRAASFLNVMNKRWILLYRGQQCDYPLLPSLSRTHWRLEGPCSIPPASLAGTERSYYWKTLAKIEPLVLSVLEEFGLPRWRHLKYRAPARWAVIQHYGLWPTPLLDFTLSLRVAATFALGLNEEAQQGYLYVVGARRIRGDLMDVHETNADEEICTRWSSD